jgi:hypothetical protein
MSAVEKSSVVVTGQKARAVLCRQKEVNPQPTPECW